DQVQGRSQGLGTRLPVGGADFVRVGSNVLRSLHLADQVLGGAADATVMDFHDLDLAFRVDDEGAAHGEAFFFDHHAEVAGDGAGGVTNHRELDLLDGLGRVVPSLVGEVRIRGDGIHFDAHLLQLVVVVGQVAQLGRADEGEVGRVEEHDGPLAAQVGVGDLNELAVVE